MRTWALFLSALPADPHNIPVDRDVATLLVQLIRSLLDPTATCPPPTTHGYNQSDASDLDFLFLSRNLAIGWQRVCLMRLLATAARNDLNEIAHAR